MHGLQEINDEGIMEKYSTVTDANNLTNNLSSAELQTISKTLSAQPSTQMSFDEAVGLIKFGKFHYFLIIIGGINLTAVLAETSSVSYVMPVSQCDLKLTTGEKGILTAIGYAGIIFSSYLWGFLADTSGRRKVMLPSLFLAFICSFLSSFTDNFIIFLILRFFNGFFISCSSSTVITYVGEFFNINNRSKNIMFTSVIHALTVMLLPIIAYFVINQEWEFYIPIINITYNSWRAFLVVASLPSLLCALAFIYLPESPKYMLSKGYEKEAIRIIKLVHRINNGANVAPPVIESIVDEMDSEFKKNNTENIIKNNNTLNNKNPFAIFKILWRQTIPLFMRPYLRSTCIVCVLQFFIFISSNGIYIWVPEIINRIAEYLNSNSDHNISICNIMYKKGLNLTAILEKDKINETLDCNTKLAFETMQYTATMEIIYAIGFLLIGVLINSLGKIVILFIITVGCGICGILLAILKIPLLGIYLTITLCVSGMAAMMVSAATVDLFPTDIRATAVCISIIAGRLGGVIGANMAGLLLDNYCEYLFSLTGLMLIVCGLLSFLVPNVQQNKSQPNDADVYEKSV